ncbi:hypothetical protein SUGI_0522630 [Cryptomeria japonica]|nr:hypothetical protein SUGI_0522630 [Cryptomeria japonica]
MAGYACSQSRSALKYPANKIDNKCDVDSYATSSSSQPKIYSSTAAAKSSFAHFKEKFKALTQSHSEKNGESPIESSKFPPKPSKSDKRNSPAKSPVPKHEERMGGSSPSDRYGWITKTAAKEKMLTPFCSNSFSVRSSRLRFNPLEGFCCAGPKAASEDGQFEANNVNRKGKQGKVSEHTQRIMVYVRVRPLSIKEEEMGARNCVGTVNNKDLFLKEIGNEDDFLRSKRNCTRTYTFDAVFPQSVEQQEVYNTSTAELVDVVLQGRNASVFCYGATGAGKTHTMLGTVETPGVMAMSIKDLFAKLEQQNCYSEPVILLSYLEIYNESVKDLLSPGRPLVLREDKQGNVSSLGITQYRAHSTNEVMDLLHQGNQNRTTESTRVNETSSRSHAILQVVVEYKVIEGLKTATRTGKLSLVDLAGSERAAATDQRTARSVEGANINKSLLALSSCINALVEGKRHIPYRDSKLTLLLKDSLGGACQTAMIANISPSHLSYSETQNTLHWADRAKEIRTKVCVANEGLEKPETQIEQSRLLLEMQKEIKQLRMQNDQLQRRLLAMENQRLPSTPSCSCSCRVLPLPCTDHIPMLESSNSGYQAEEQNAEEDNIQELKSNLQAFKEDSDRVKMESSVMEKQLATHRMSLKHEYNPQLKHKDGIIHKLCETAPGLEQRIQSTQFGPISTHLSSKEPLPSPERPIGKTISASHNVYDDPHSKSDQSERKSGFLDVQLKSSSQSTSVVGCSLPASGKNRAFGDITNRPAAPKIRNRIDTRNAPSMLLQPGFYRELS